MRLQMGLGKTITCVSLIAATLHSAKRFSEEPLIPVIPPQTSIPNIESLDLQASHFTGAVWGMPPTTPNASFTASPNSSGSGSNNTSGLSQRALAKQRAQDKAAESAYMRQKRLKVKSRGTLIICPLSTVANWEEQFREHWGGGGVVVVGGAGTSDEGNGGKKKEKNGWSSGSATGPGEPLICCPAKEEFKDEFEREMAEDREMMLL